MAYNVSSAFREQLYSGESEFRAILTIGETTIDNDQIASISISSPIIDDSKQVFYVGTFISQKITIKFKNMDGIDVHSGDNIDLSIGQYVNNEWVDVPIGKFLVDDLAEDYYEKCEISCLDYAVKFKPNIDYSLCFTNGKATIKEILEYICDYFDVEIGDYPTINDDIEIGTYDSTVSGKQWISYIAELKGCNAKIDRLGRLTLQPLKQPSNVPINALESASFELGEEFNITKVTFFDAVRNYTYGDDEGNTLFIRQDNPFITDTKVVQNIYDNLCAIKYSASGKSFDIEDADAHPINVNTIYGETSQSGTPTPSSPIPINNVSGDNEIIICGKNLFDMNIYSTTASHSSCTIEITDNAINITPTGNSYIGSAIKYPQYVNENNRPTCIRVKPSTKYTFSINNTGNSYITYVDSNYQAINTVDYPLNNLTSYTFTTPSNCKYVMFRLGKNSGTTPYSFENIQLEENETATTYEAYNGTTYSINLPVENLFDNNTDNIGFSESSTISTINNGLKITCTTSGTYRWYAIPLSNTNKLLGKKITITTDMTVSNNQNGQVALYFINKNNYSLGASIGSSGAKTTGKITLSVDVPTTIPSGNTHIGLLLYSGVNQTSVNDYVNYDNIQLEQGSKANTYTPYGLVPVGYNLFDKNDLNDLNGFFHTTVDKITSNDGRKTVYIPCKPNTTYTVSILKSSVVMADINRFCIAYTKTMPDINVYVYGVVNNKTNVLTITTGSDAQYLVAYIYNQAYDGSGISYQDIINSLRIEEGTVSHANDHAIELNEIGNYQDKIFRNSGKNLCDGINQNVWVSGSYDLVGISTGSSGLIIATNGGKYTISTTTTQTRYRACCIDTLPTSQQSVTGYNGVLYDNTNRTFTIDTSGHNYLVVNATDLTKIQIEEGSTATEYEPYGNGDWYWKKSIGTDILDENSGWSIMTVSTNKKMFKCKDSNYITGVGFYKTLVGNNEYNRYYMSNCGMTGYQTLDNGGVGVTVAYGYRANGISVNANDGATVEQWKSFVASNNIIIKGGYSTPQYLKITYQPLIDQLNALQNAGLFEGTNHITIEPNDLTPTIDIDYFKNSHFNIWSLKTHNFGDFTLDAWDNIDYDLDGEHYLTLNNNTIKYEMSIMSDVESKIPTKQQEVTTNVVGGDDKTNIKKIKTNVDQLNASVNILSQQQTDTQTDVSQLQIDVNGINTTVEHIENVEITGLQSEISSVNHTVSSIANLFQITGGINKIRNSAFLLPDEVWEFTDSGTNPEHTNLGNSYNSTLSGKTISIAEIKARSTKIKSKSENITDLKTDGTKYTFNFYHKQDVDTTTTIKMYSTENNNIKAFNDIVITGQQPFTNYEVSFVPTYTNYTLEIIVANATSIGYAYLYDMMLNSGDKQPWQPASDEIYSTTLQMSRLGLQVYSVGDGTLTILGSDGLTSWETSDGRTKGRLVSKRTVDGDRVKVVTTQSVKLVSDATKTDEELAQEDKWVETTTKVSGRIAKIIYMESGVQ